MIECDDDGSDSVDDDDNNEDDGMMMAGVRIDGDSVVVNIMVTFISEVAIIDRYDGDILI